MAELVSMTYEQSRTEHFEALIKISERKIKYWEARIDRTRPNNMMDNAFINASNAGWECNFYKDALEALENQPQWISPGERLPEENTTVLIALRDGHVFQAHYAYDGWDLWEGFTGDIVVWMPMPNPPKEG